MLDMYKGLVNSPETTITNNINTADTIIYVLDPARVPDQLPNLMTLGTGTNAETVRVLSIDGNALTVQRGFQGVAKDWLAGTIIARNFTEYDHNAFKENIETLYGGKVDKIAGKGLSTEDYTTAEKTKLEGIATGANKIIVNNTLTSTSTTEALSAAQGKVLKDAADAHLADYTLQIQNRVKKDGDRMTGLLDIKKQAFSVIQADFAATPDGVLIKTKLTENFMSSTLEIHCGDISGFNLIYLKFAHTKPVTQFSLKALGVQRPVISIGYDENDFIIIHLAFGRDYYNSFIVNTRERGNENLVGWTAEHSIMPANATDVIIIPYTN